MFRRIAICALLFSTCILLLSGCSRESNSNNIDVGRPAVAVDTQRVSLSDMKETISVVGVLSPKFSSEIKSQVTGVISEIYVTEWVRVKKGTLLARLDSREAEADLSAAKANLMQTKVSASRAQREWERATKLKQAGLITQQGLDDANSAMQAADAATEAAQAQLHAAEFRMSKTEIRSPMDGIISYRGVSVGDRVENMGGGPMFRIVDDRKFDLTVSVPSTKIEQVRIGQSLYFTTDAIAGRSFQGKVAFINPAADQSSRAVNVVVEIENTTGELKAGYFVKGEIVTSLRPSVVQVSKSALLSWDTDANTADVFVLQQSRAHRVTIHTGTVAGEDVEVIKGLSPGDQVVTRGGFNLKDGDQVIVASTATGA